MATPEVVISNGLRWIAPYHTRLRARAKGRWLGRTVLDVLLDEFKGFGGAYYTAALAAGRIRINGERIAANRVIANGDALSHDAHVHEAPVVDAPITVLGQSDDLVAVVKPASWPTHPTGRYAHNSMSSFVTEAVLGGQKALTIHRLDRLTSGALIFATTKEASARWHNHFRQRLVQKRYVARVRGHFPDGLVTADVPLRGVSHRRLRHWVAEPTPGAHDAKDSRTDFRRLAVIPSSAAAGHGGADAVDGVDSIVECFPRTGRGHQIRVHLRWLGFPIANDPLYGPNTRLEDMLAGKEEWDLSGTGGEPAGSDGDAFDRATHIQTPDFGDACFDPLCPWCARGRVLVQKRTLEGLWLHAQSYKVDVASPRETFSVETPLPSWAGDQR